MTTARRSGRVQRRPEPATSSAGRRAGQLRAGVARRDVTDRNAGPVNDPLYVKALVLSDGAVTVAVVTVDAVALAEIGPVPGDFLPQVRQRLQRRLGLAPDRILINASHCHGQVCPRIAALTVAAVEEAWHNLLPVTAGTGVGHEDRVSENRRLRLADGTEADVRRAYPLAPDEQLDAVGPIDPEIGILRLDRLDGRPLAVVYNFACHPIQGVPGGGNTADLVGFASRAIEAGCGEGATALFLQGCAGDANPFGYKDFEHPPDAETLGNLLGLAVLRALPSIRAAGTARLRLVSARVALPRADLAPWIAALEQERDRLVGRLTGTTLNLRTFLQLAARHGLSPEFPSGYAYRYLHERALGRGDLDRLDAGNRQALAEYVDRIHTMEQLIRLHTNLDLLRLHAARNAAAGGAPVEVDVSGLRIGDFVLLTFPGELSVQIGLNLKRASPHRPTFVAAYTNGYIYYAPTAAQLRQRGLAQEDSDCFLASAWQDRFEAEAIRLLGRL